MSFFPFILFSVENVTFSLEIFFCCSVPVIDRELMWNVREKVASLPNLKINNEKKNANCFNNSRSQLRIMHTKNRPYNGLFQTEWTKKNTAIFIFNFYSSCKCFGKAEHQEAHHEYQPRGPRFRDRLAFPSFEMLFSTSIFFQFFLSLSFFHCFLTRDFIIKKKAKQRERKSNRKSASEALWKAKNRKAEQQPSFKRCYCISPGYNVCHTDNGSSSSKIELSILCVCVHMPKLSYFICRCCLASIGRMLFYACTHTLQKKMFIWYW